ncbi:predicted protein [Uncinocarpus reesii 1704]|uniref:Uncharacterized protein n=1 Tax=Uncinocarpus reesii (strain UAMH 1704) TaxID=336963 RepID=C4JQ70_UNCRE|nr:uncharacterized protein UREG_03303 [Uncinocarpus reesii 1704]EEP78457.1 predicted protein [Uncinocarpus reesii 1704]
MVKSQMDNLAILPAPMTYTQTPSSFSRSGSACGDGNLDKFTEKPQYRTPVHVPEPPANFKKDAQLPIVDVKPQVIGQAGRSLIHDQMFYDSAAPVPMQRPQLTIDFDRDFVLNDLKELRGQSCIIDWPTIASQLDVSHKKTAIARYRHVLQRYRKEKDNHFQDK